MNPIIQIASAAVDKPVTANVRSTTRRPFAPMPSTWSTRRSMRRSRPLRVAGNFAKALGVPLTLVHFRAVPYALPVDAAMRDLAGRNRGVRRAAFERRAPTCACASYLCRDERSAIPAGVQAAFVDRHWRPAQLVADRGGAVAAGARSGRAFRGVRRQRRAQGEIPCLTCSIS